MKGILFLFMEKNLKFMVIESIELKNFRNYKDLNIEFDKEEILDVKWIPIEDIKKMKKEEFNQIKYQNEFKRKNYDRFELVMPKGQKEIIKQKAMG